MGIGDRTRELRDLVAVHEYSCTLIENALGYAVPIPEHLRRSDPDLSVAEALSHWLGLLDLAVTPQMLREGLVDDKTDLAGALLRYFVRKQSAHRIDRDKTDLVSTYIYKDWCRGRSVRTVDVADPYARPDFARVPEFTGRLYAVLCDVKLPELPEEHRQLLREFPFVRQELQDLHRFDELIDSGIMERVRRIKETFGRSMYHPYVLAALAEYNVVAGAKFDELFRHAVHDIRSFAVAAERDGGSLLSRVDGDITVKELTEVEETILEEEYGSAHPKFEKVSKLRKAIGRRATQPAEGPAKVAPGKGIKELAEEVRQKKEAAQTRSLANSIRDFVRAADPDSALGVPLARGIFMMSPAERDAFAASYAGENSFRGKYSAALVDIVSTTARMREEMACVKEKLGSVYLWRPHAEHLTYLVSAVQGVIENGLQVSSIAQQRGLQDKVSVLSTSLQKLETTRQHVRDFLKTLANQDCEQG